jgi:hypothetical protein
MKPFIITTLLLSAGTALYAQQTPPVSKDVEQKLRELHRYDMNALPGADGRLYRMPNKLLDSIPGERYKRLLEAQRFAKGGLVQSTFSHNTSRGKVYNLSPDNMPCLVPYSKSVAAMPNGFKGVMPDEKMNVMPKQRIIPEEEVKP